MQPMSFFSHLLLFFSKELRNGKSQKQAERCKVDDNGGNNIGRLSCITLGLHCNTAQVKIADKDCTEDTTNRVGVRQQGNGNSVEAVPMISLPSVNCAPPER